MSSNNRAVIGADVRNIAFAGTVGAVSDVQDGAVIESR